jgi:hypothetical protein
MPGELGKGVGPVMVLARLGARELSTTTMPLNQRHVVEIAR